MDLKLGGRKGIVTGASKGIGKRIGNLMLESGMSLAFCARNEDEIVAAEEEWAGKGYKVKGTSVDVADAEAYKAWLADAADWLGGCDAFVPNVSAGGGSNEEQWRANFEVDLMGAVRGMEVLLPHLSKNNGSAVFIVSTAALETYPVVQPYNALKASLIVYAKQLSQVIAKDGVRLNCVSPGATLFEGGNWERHQKNLPDYYKATIESIPFGRLGSAEEIADAVVFLLSQRASWITGINLTVDGGQTKRVSL
ncbi:SDR family NAD(P)-dependent oxidoreductase [Parasphingorhabdus cellanae]|uniref:SDR family oxidoreductase n=1 Tax=Parasphingorhabdus cellanae TaxID=2806553 RepID=A0ABX7T6P6_9SPHN|nr:SDR family oxidoreductase [Parasphingorhabdus cellanae]QTD57274.1 SDR family oxidoreductase [Parasphingorhabdus cellanae]